MNRILVTGGSGFFGSVLKDRLLASGCSCVNVDLQPDDAVHPALVSVRGDIRDRALLDRLWSEHRFTAVVHCAALLAHVAADRGRLWSCNVEGTETLAKVARERGVGKFVFISSNCLWAHPFGRPVREEDRPEPREIYGASKWAAEQALARTLPADRTVVLRTPTIMASGRLGLLSILFDFIREGRRVWVVGRGENRYQFIYAQDLADACVRARAPHVHGVFNVGSDEVPTLREAYQYVIDRAGTNARVAAMPRAMALPLMRAAYALGVSPLGPYQYRMIAEEFIFDTSRIKRDLGWRPTRTNGEMLYEAYAHYARHHDEIHARVDVSAHRQPVSMGAIRLLKWLS